MGAVATVVGRPAASVKFDTGVPRRADIFD